MIWISIAISFAVVFIMSMLMEKIYGKNENNDTAAGAVIFIALTVNGISSYFLCRDVLVTAATVLCSLIIMSGAAQYIKK